MTLERTILNNLIFNEDFTRKVLPFLKDEYFSNEGERKTFSLINNYILKYNRIPNPKAITIDLQKQVDVINEHQYKSTIEVIESLEKDSEHDQQWLLDHTEKFCQEKAVLCGIMQSLDIIEDKTGKKSRGMIPKILQDALGVSFDTHIGHDFIEDYLTRYEFYHADHKHIPFDIDYLNKITKNGVIPKTLNCFISPTGVGKTLNLCHFAGYNLLCGYNVLYITLEMAEEKIAERIDANLLDIPIDVLEMISKDNYEKKIEQLKTKPLGKLIVKEYPTAGAGAAHFRHLINELKIKKNFKPDIIYIDYLNICMSSRLRLGSSINSYLYVKSIAEELRGLAVETNLPIITATQTNREGAGSSDFDMTHTSESFGLPMTLDLLIAIQTSEQLADLGQYQFRQLKNRYSDVNKFRKFVVGVDYTKMRLYNIEEHAQPKDDDEDTIPVFERSGKFDKSTFKDFS